MNSLQGDLDFESYSSEVDVLNEEPLTITRLMLPSQR